MSRPTKKEVARRTNVFTFGRNTQETASELSRFRRAVPKKSRDLSIIVAQTNAILEQTHAALPKGISASHLLIFEKAMALALRDAIKDIDTIECPKCYYKYEPVCPKCGKPHAISVPDAALEKNQIQAMNKLLDKFFPNLAAISGDININATITTLKGVITRCIIEYVPPERRMECAREINTKLGEIPSETA